MNTTTSTQSQPSYYYTVTGEVVKGTNTSDTTFSGSTSRFPINIQGGIDTQGEGWDNQTGDISPLYENDPLGNFAAEYVSGESVPVPTKL